MKSCFKLGLYVQYKTVYLYNYPIKTSYVLNDFGNLVLTSFECKIVNGEMI